MEKASPVRLHQSCLWHLNPQEFAHARAICTANHIRNKTLLDACTLDTAVLQDEAAAKVFIQNASSASRGQAGFAT
jgi:hypothetical protein